MGTVLAMILFGIPITYLIINIVFSRILINGVEERDPSKVYKYKWFSIVSFIFLIIGIVLEIIIGSTNPQERSKSMAEIFIGGIFKILLSIYFIFVIHSLEMKFREQPIPIVQQQVVGYQQQPYSAPPNQDYVNATAPTNNPNQQMYPSLQAPIVVSPYAPSATAPYPNNYPEKS
mgnify:CR=1 FL=1